MAADGGDADAMFSLARLKELGLDGEVSLLSRIGNAIRTGAASASAATSTPHDSVAEAAQLYGAAAELGHVRSAVALADLLTRGAGMARDVPRAVQLLRTAGGAAVWRHWDTSICPLDSVHCVELCMFPWLFVFD